MSSYANDINAIAGVCEAAGSSWDAINPESAARMRVQNRFKTGLEIAQYTADIMRRDMAEYAAKNDLYQKALWQHQKEVFIPVRLDGCRAAL